MIYTQHSLRGGMNTMDEEQGMFSAFFNAGQDSLRSKLNGCRDLTEVEDVVRLFWDSMQHDFTDKVTATRERELGYELFVVAKSAISCMLSVSNADVLFKSNTDVQPQKAHKFDWKNYIGAGASALLAAYLFFEGMWAPMSVAAFVTAWQTVALRRDEIKLNAPPALPEAHGVPKADIEELLRRLDRLSLNMDAAYERMKGEDTKQSLPETIQWSNDQLEAVQMLWEALKQDDGKYALKTLPQLIMSLEQQGMTICEYTESKAAYFELLPGVEDGYTVRPALMLGDKLIAKGQVTQKMT